MDMKRMGCKETTIWRILTAPIPIAQRPLFHCSKLRDHQWPLRENMVIDEIRVDITEPRFIEGCWNQFMLGDSRSSACTFRNFFLCGDIPLIFRSHQLQNLPIELALTCWLPVLFKQVNVGNRIRGIVFTARLWAYFLNIDLLICLFNIVI